MIKRTTEKDFEDWAEQVLNSLPSRPFVSYKPSQFNFTTCCVQDELMKFLQATQEKEIRTLAKKRNSKGLAVIDAEFKNWLENKICDQIRKKGKLDALRNGVKVDNVTLKLMYPNQLNADNVELVELHSHNSYSVIRQVPADTKHKQIVDMVLFVNGLSIFLIELKSNSNGQQLADAEDQFRKDRDPADPLFTANFGYIAAFAVDNFNASMTTKLEKDDTVFFPYDQGTGTGTSRTTGNPPAGPGTFDTHYIFDEVLTPDNIENIIYEYCYLDGNSPSSLLIFPRYHQHRAVEKTVKGLIEANGKRCDFLIEQFAGAGKSAEISWIASRAMQLRYEASNTGIYDKIIIVENRISLYKQITNSIEKLNMKKGVVATTAHSSDLLEALSGSARIVVTTLQKFLHVFDQLQDTAGKKYLTLIDEVQEGYDGKGMKALYEALSQADKKRYDSGELDDYTLIQEQLNNKIAKSGKPSNVSFAVFSATPTDRTYEMFGTPNDGGRLGAWDTYTMNQAIDEGYILNPLENYVFCAPEFIVRKTTPTDNEYKEHEAISAILSKSLYSPKAIKIKAKHMCSLFTRNVLYSSLDGEEKGMIFTPNRKTALVYYLAVKELIKEFPEFDSIRPLIAFEGGLEYNGEHYKTAELNGFPDDQVPQQFREKYNMLIVADKYQVGFDEPKLCALFCDKKMHGGKLVQGFSRNDRIVRGKDKICFIYDYINGYDVVKEAFLPYFNPEERSASLGTDIAKLCQDIYDYNIIHENEVNDYYAAYADADIHNTSVDLDNGLSYRRAAHERIKEQTDESLKRKFVSLLRSYRNSYETIELTSKITDERSIKLYQFVADMLRDAMLYSPARRHTSSDFNKIADSVTADSTQYISKQYNFDTHATADDEDDNGRIIGTGNDGDSHASTIRRKQLSIIIKKVNSVFAPFDDGSPLYRLSQAIEALFKNPSEDLREECLNNSFEAFKFCWQKRVEDLILMEYLGEKDDQDYNDFLDILLKNEEAEKEIADTYVNDAYHTIRK